VAAVAAFEVAEAQSRGDALWPSTIAKQKNKEGFCHRNKTPDERMK
jgi:hypothetical protein